MRVGVGVVGCGLNDERLLSETSLAGRGAKYCDGNVCLSVCPLPYRRNHTGKLPQIFGHVDCGRGSDLLWRRCDILRASGFVDNVVS